MQDWVKSDENDLDKISQGRAWHGSRITLDWILLATRSMIQQIILHLTTSELAKNADKSVCTSSLVV